MHSNLVCWESAIFMMISYICSFFKACGGGVGSGQPGPPGKRGPTGPQGSEGPAGPTGMTIIDDRYGYDCTMFRNVTFSK
jgi:hypothetical protein